MSNNVVIKTRNISTIKKLSELLGYEREQLLYISNNLDKYYRKTNEIKKPDGSLRITYDTKPILKNLHKNIKGLFFDNIDYPEYLTGGIKGTDYINNCTIHTGNNILISEDITKFYDSIDISEVYKMWKWIFQLPHEVSELLSKLVTYKGCVAQGSVTGSSIAVLLFWDLEPDLVEWFKKENMTYTRYIDDISLSTKRNLTKQEKSEVISKIIGMLKKKNVKINRKKHKIYDKSQNMQLHRVNVNKRKPSFGREKKDNLRAAIHQTQQMFETSNCLQQYTKRYNSVIGRVNHYGRLHNANKMKEKMKLIQPKKFKHNFNIQI